jgi:hypothetical protein
VQNPRALFRRNEQRFAAENAIKSRNLEHDPILPERIMFQNWRRFRRGGRYISNPC